jgi:pimeloyl-ACP methyl ester carboxylesterase
MKYIDTTDGRIAYDEEGQGDAVLLLHGSFSADWFAPSAKFLTGYHVLRQHRAGYGQSKDLSGGASVKGYAENAAAVLADAGVTRAHIVGHSTGASIALQLAATRPDLVGSLVLLEAAFPYAPDEPKGPAMPRAIEAARAGDYEKAFDFFLGGVGGPQFREAFIRELGEEGLREGIASSEYFFTAEAAAFGGWSFGSAEMASVTAPTLLVVGGEGDRLQTPHRARSAHLAAGLPNAETVVLSGVSHIMPLEKPELIANTITEFVSNHSL